MKKMQFLVIGVGRFGSALATELFEQGHEVVAVDREESRVESIMDQVTHALVGDATDPDMLEEIGVANFDTVVIAIGADFESNILATVAAKSAGAERVMSKAVSELAARVLSRVGADAVIRPEHDMGIRLAHQLTTPNLVDAFNLGDDHTVIEIEAEESIFGTLKELRLANRFGIQVIAVHHDGDLVVSPGAGYEVGPGDKLVLIGSNESIDKFRDHLTG